MRHAATFALVLSAVATPAALRADVTPLQIALFHPIQLANEKTAVVGLRLNLFYGKNRDVYGLDLGLVNVVERDSVSVAAGLANVSRRHGGVQVGLANASRTLYGFQFGLVNFHESGFGWQFGAINIAAKPWLPMLGILTNWAERPRLGQFTLGFNHAWHTPLQIAGILNNSRRETVLQVAGGANYGESVGLQIGGVFNRAEKVTSQWALGVNVAEHSHLPQFAGVLNVADRTSAQLAVLGNWSRNETIQLSALGNYSGRTRPAGSETKEPGPEGSRGLQLSGGANYAQNVLVQFAGIVNVNERAGAQVAAGGNLAGDARLQLAGFNRAQSADVQVGLLNLADESRLAQVGLFNRSLSTRGFMLGLVNESHELLGLQVGLLNIAKNARLPVTLLFNFNYDEREVRSSTGFVPASWTPFQFAFYAPGQVFTRETPVLGLRLSLLYGRNATVFGLDVGLVNRSEQARGFAVGGLNVVEGDFVGAQLGLAGYVEGDATGALVGPLLQFTGGTLRGFALGAVVFTGGDVRGLQLGVLFNGAGRSLLPQFSLGANVAQSAPLQLSGLGNYSEEKIIGPQISVGVNYARGAFAQVGGLGNYSDEDVVGFQVGGLFNRARFVPLQIALGGNQATLESWFQFAGIFNVVSEELRNAPFGRGLDPYAQVSTFFNLSANTHLQIAAFNIEQRRNFVQLGFVNFARKGHFQAGGVNVAFGFRGTQVGFVNVAGDSAGLQVGAVNVVDDFRGVAVGAWNLADDFRGLSVGLFNFADYLRGVQIGIINIHRKGSVPVMLGVNAGW